MKKNRLYITISSISFFICIVFIFYGVKVKQDKEENIKKHISILSNNIGQKLDYIVFLSNECDFCYQQIALIQEKISHDKVCLFILCFPITQAENIIINNILTSENYFVITDNNYYTKEFGVKYLPTTYEIFNDDIKRIIGLYHF